MKMYIKSAASHATIKAADYIERTWANDADAAGYNVYVDADMNVTVMPKQNTEDKPEFTVDTIREDDIIKFEVELKFPTLASTDSGVMDGLDDFQNIVEDWIKVANLAALITDSEFDLNEMED